MLIMPVNLAERGLMPVLIRIRAIFRAGANVASCVQGTVVMLDLGLSDAAVRDNDRNGGDDSGLANVTECLIRTETCGPILVAMGVIADNAEGTFMLYGIDKVKVQKDGGADISAGANLTIDTGTAAARGCLTNNAVAVSAGTGEQDQKIVWGRNLDLVTADASTGLAARVWFNGLTGLGIEGPIHA